MVGTEVGALFRFTGAWIFYHYVLNKAGSTDPEAIRKAAYQVDIPPGGTHMGWGAKFKGEGDPEAGQNGRAFAVMMQWQGGLNYCVWPERYAEREAILVPLPKWKDRK